MPTTMNTRAKHTQAGTPDCYLQGKKNIRFSKKRKHAKENKVERKRVILDYVTIIKSIL